MRIWTVRNQKGGSGKTTLVLHTAVAAIERGLAVSVADLDTLRSAEKWAELRQRKVRTPAPAIVHGSMYDLEGMIEGARQSGTDLVLVDTPAATNNTTLRADSAAHMIIVPTKSSFLDVQALDETLHALQDSAKLGRTVVVRTASSGDKKMEAEIARLTRDVYEVPLLDTELPNQAAFATTLSAGRGITEKGGNKRAATIVDQLLDELLKHDRRIERARKRETV